MTKVLGIALFALLAFMVALPLLMVLHFVELLIRTFFFPLRVNTSPNWAWLGSNTIAFRILHATVKGVAGGLNWVNKIVSKFTPQ